VVALTVLALRRNLLLRRLRSFCLHSTSCPLLQALEERSAQNLLRQHLRHFARGPGSFAVNQALISLPRCSTMTQPRMVYPRGTGMACMHIPEFVLMDDNSFFLPSSTTRPVNGAGERVAPSNLLEHRHSHDFLGPCCFCASLESDGPSRSYTEASIFVAMSGPTAGKYTAACATGQCRYWGKFHIHMTSLDGLMNARVCVQFPSSNSMTREAF
jgi:hypothetical protein